MAKSEPLAGWNAAESAELYRLKDWGAGYFDVSSGGEVVVKAPTANGTATVSLMDVIQGVKNRGIGMPLLLRIENLLDGQISRLNQSFAKSISQNGYKGQFTGVFPIKVNQQEQVIDEISKFGQKFNFGFEAGSKAELLIALSMVEGEKSCVVCNGYKDEEFIDLGLQAVKMGYNIFFVLEMPGELDLIIERSKALGIAPRIGVRLKLATRAGGHWTESGGDRSVFGLTTSQVVEVVDQLKANGLLDSLQLLHYHLGSQVPNIRDIRAAVMEASRFYADLVAEGAPMGNLDLGGGLAVDYDGSQTNYVHSKNYTLDEYTYDIIEVVMGTLNEREIDHPNIITESGRATVAYHSTLLFNILDAAKFDPAPLPEKLPEDINDNVVNLMEVNKSLTIKNLQECYNDAIYYRDEVRELFKHGQVSLRERSVAENIFFHVMFRIKENLHKSARHTPDLDDLPEALADIYYANMSVFQSLPDIWAIDQIFPVMPIHRLNEKPTRDAIFADITCDCDGKIDRFADLHDVRKTLPVHPLKAGEEYYFGTFLVGAYQETLGDLHNLLGDTNVVSIRIQEDGSFDLVRQVEGDSINDVLSYVEYDPKQLLARFRQKAESAVRRGFMSVEERRKVVEDYEASLRGYTYFER